MEVKMSVDLVMNGLQQGLILAIITYGIMIPFRFLDFTDLTADGAYPLGGAVCAIFMSSGIHPALAIPCCMICSGCMGVCVALIHLKLRINSMLAGIILSTMAYSVNLRLMGRPNIALFECGGLFGVNILGNMTIICLLLASCVVPFAIFLRTDFGLRFRAVGLNQNLAKQRGISIDKYTIAGLFVACSLFGLAGSLIVQLQSYMDVGIGVGILIHGLASLMIGEAIIGNATLNRQLVAPLLGALVYQQVQGAALSLGLAPSDLKFFTGAIVLLVIAMKRTEAKMFG
jgi:putative ABC transport system permease protein